MKALLPNAIFIAFTGTPLLKAGKQKSIGVFGRYIHTYKFDQAVREGVVAGFALRGAGDRQYRLPCTVYLVCFRGARCRKR